MEWGILSKLGYSEIFELNTVSDRVFCELSEYLKIIEIGQTEQKLWSVKGSLF